MSPWFQANLFTLRHNSRTFLLHAEEGFQKNDMLQASEKAWGAVAHYAKAVARELGWPNRSHEGLKFNIRVLVAYTSNPSYYRRLFIVVEGLHSNFYEDGRPFR